MENVGRDKITQGANSKLKIDNQTSSGDGWRKIIFGGVIVGIILLVIGYAAKIILGF